MIFLGIWLTAAGIEAGGSTRSLLSRVSARVRIQTGMSSVVIGSTMILGGYLLNAFRSSIKSFGKTQRNLAQVFLKLHNFLVYASILLIIYLAGVLLVFITAFSNAAA